MHGEDLFSSQASWSILHLLLWKMDTFEMRIFKEMGKQSTVETQYNEILGTGTFCLLYQIFCYISSQ